jgi:receptor expression-enhancing protein 1/2/3/4
MQYEPNIEHRLLHLRAKSGQLLNFYVKNFADKGTAFFMDVLRYVVSDKAEGSNLEVMKFHRQCDMHFVKFQFLHVIRAC